MSVRSRFDRRTDVSEIAFQAVKYLVLALFLAFVLLPIVYIVSVSLRPPDEIFSDPHLVPRTVTLVHWKEGLATLADGLKNSFIIASGTVVLSLLLSVPSAYVFGRKEFPGKRLAFYFITLSLLFPFILLVIPITKMWTDLGLYNTYPGLWIAYQSFVTPFSIWILRDFFSNLPVNLEEAAQVYGCTQFSAFVRVILPLSMPAIAAVGFLAFLAGWNDFLFSHMLTTNLGPRPAIVELYVTVHTGESTAWGALMAQSLMTAGPPVVLYLLARRQLSDAFALD